MTQRRIDIRTCDTCGKVAKTRSGEPYNRIAVDTWYLVLTPMAELPDDNTTPRQRDFCSRRCLVKYYRKETKP